jgi:drug/metabolite transporter (DMT)-like permease
MSVVAALFNDKPREVAAYALLEPFVTLHDDPLSFNASACQRHPDGSNVLHTCRDESEALIDPRAPRERDALWYGVGAVLLWSTVATGFKLGLAEMQPLELLWLGAAISFGFFAVVSLATGRWPSIARLAARDWLRLGALGLLNPFLYYLILFEAYARLPAQIAQPLNYTWAITLALLAIPILRQPLTLRMFGGIAISYAGVLILLSQGRLDGFASVDGLGVALALGSTLVWATYWLATVRTRVDPLVMMTVSFAVGAIAIGIACGFQYGLPALTLRRLGFGAWVGLIEMGVTFLLWQQALRLTAHAGRIAQLIFLSPFISLLLIDRVLGEHVHPSSFVGLTIIIAGLLIARPHPARPP